MAKWSETKDSICFLMSNFYLVLFIKLLLNPHPDPRVCLVRLRLIFLGFLFFTLDTIFSSEESFFRAVINMIVQIYLFINAPSVIAAEAPIPVPAPSPIPAPAA